MKKQIRISLHFFHLLCYIFYIFTGINAVKGSHYHGHYHHPRGSVKLFVFGDSYADTGNWKTSAISWKEPYGITFPGKPAGRFSDGRVLTDYVASFLGIGSPIPFERRKGAKKSNLKYGMNFAYGGTGVFDTLNGAPNMATQIQNFQQLLEQKLYTKQDLNSSIALISLAGNDYNTFLYKNGNLKDLGNFTTSIINEVSKNLQQLHGLGVQKFGITGLPPIGCLPAMVTTSLFKNCSETWNSASKFHNQKLHQALQILNFDTHANTFQLLDLFSSFMSAFTTLNHTGKLNSENPLKACCLGKTSNYSCGGIDNGGAKKYVICKNPKLSIFWDMVHPSQNGWHQVYLALRSSLHPLLPSTLVK